VAGRDSNDTLLQITERIERKLQETPYLDYIKSYTNPGQSTIFVYLKGSTGPKEVSDAWYQVRKKIKDVELTLPQVSSARSPMTNSGIHTASSMDSRRTGSPIVSCATMWRRSGLACCRCPMSTR
jgi:Cation/multidrug efflux pump